MNPSPLWVPVAYEARPTVDTLALRLKALAMLLVETVAYGGYAAVGFGILAPYLMRILRLDMIVVVPSQSDTSNIFL